VDEQGQFFYSTMNLDGVNEIRLSKSPKSELWWSSAQMTGRCPSMASESGIFSFGRRADGKLDLNTLYLFSNDLRVWRLARVNGGWGQVVPINAVLKLENVRTETFIPTKLRAAVVVGDQEAYVCVEGGPKAGGNPRTAPPPAAMVFRITDWKTIEPISPLLSLPPPQTKRGTIPTFPLSLVKSGAASPATPATPESGRQNEQSEPSTGGPSPIPAK